MKKENKEKEAEEPESTPIKTISNIPDVKEVPVTVLDKGTKYKAKK